MQNVTDKSGGFNESGYFCFSVNLALVILFGRSKIESFILMACIGFLNAVTTLVQLHTVLATTHCTTRCKFAFKQKKPVKQLIKNNS